MTTAPTETRSFDVAELRASPEQRLIEGLAVPFNETTDIGPYKERFIPGAFARTIRERAGKVKLTAQHDNLSLPVGRATSLKETRAGLLATFRVSSTPRGDELLELVRDGTVSDLSITFAPVESRIARDGVVERTEVKLLAVGAVSHGAYESARVLAVRSKEQEQNEAARHPAQLRHRLRILEMKP